MSSKIKSVYKYNLFTQIKPVTFYYSIALFLIIFTFILNLFGSFKLNINGFEFATFIFLFVVSLVDFAENFNMLSINCVSRKNIFIGKVLSFASLSLAMAFIDRLIVGLTYLMSDLGEINMFGSAIDDIFTALSPNVFLANVEAILISFSSYISVIVFGTFLSILFYRANKAIRVLIAAGVPIFIVIFLPIILGLAADTDAGSNILDFIIKLLSTPLSFTLTCIDIHNCLRIS